VHGAILTEALASRFGVHIEVTTDWELARHLGVPAAAVNAAIALNADLAAGKLSWAPYAEAGVMPRSFLASRVALTSSCTRRHNVESVGSICVDHVRYRLSWRIC
jgi:hypothetical protein